MKLRHFIWIIAAIVAVVSMAAGVAVLISRYLNHTQELDYIECDCDSDPVLEKESDEE